MDSQAEARFLAPRKENAESDLIVARLEAVVLKRGDLAVLVGLWFTQLLILAPYLKVPPIYDGAWNYHDLMQASCSGFRCADLVLADRGQWGLSAGSLSVGRPGQSC